MMMLSAAFLLLSMAVSNEAHLCLISPHQRGSMDGINKPAAADCILLNGTCGGRPDSRSHIGIRAGENFTVTWQKNLDHYNSAMPGYFSVAMGHAESALTLVYKTPDTSDPSLTLYSASIMVPEIHGQVILQTKYVTSNPKAPAAFVQCADVEVMPRRREVQHDVISYA